MPKPLSGLEFSVAGYFLFSPRLRKFQFLQKNRVFFSLVGPPETGKSQFFTIGSKSGTSLLKFDKIYFFHQHSQPLYDDMQKEIENLEFVRGVHFEYTDLFKNNETKNLLMFDNSCEKICNSKAFCDNATTGRHRGLSAFYIKHNLFHQSKLGRDFEFQNTHLVLFESPRDMIQISTFSSDLGHGPELIGWYRTQHLSLRSNFVGLVATNRRSITFL